ncbi:MAG: DUF1598 domain-containing protein [Planctomycetota bacterium]
MSFSSSLGSLVRHNWPRFVAAGLAAAVSVSAVGSQASAGDNANASGPALPAPLHASKLRVEARLAAEDGDFLKAVTKLEQAAQLSGDRVTARKAADSRKSIEAAGGSMADFSSLMNLIMTQTSPPALWVANGEEDGGSMTPYMQGVFLGVPAMTGLFIAAQDNSRLQAAFELARTANTNRDVHMTSGLRLVSLPRLEQHLVKLQAAGQPVPEDVATLAGLTAVEYLFVFPGSGDVVIGGPAGDWKRESDGRTVNATNGRPTLRLDDLITLSRTFSPGGRGFLMCTIDPKADQVKAVREFASRTQLTAGNVRRFTQQVEEMLGLQSVTVLGVPNDSRVASVIVDADYQMKLIGIGRRDGAPGMKSYFELAGRAERNGAAMDALRWWMTVGYDAIQMSPDQSAFEFTGRSIRCLSENQLVETDGTRRSTGKVDGANAEFARLFTENLPALAEQDAVFADLQNIFDLALATTMISTMELQHRADWKPEVFRADSTFPTASVDVPKELMTAASSRVWKGGSIIVQVAGGVRVDVRDVVANPDSFEVSADVVNSARNASPVGQSGSWWWDAAAR